VSTIYQPQKTLLPCAVEEFIEARQAERLSPNTIIDYSRTLRRLQDFLGDDVYVDCITSRDLRRFLSSLIKITDKTLLNYHIGLSAFFSWLVNEEILESNPVKKIKRPKPEIRVIRPFGKDDIVSFLDLLTEQKYWSRPTRWGFRQQLPNLYRNRAIIFVLLDTGIRAGELCGLKFKDMSGLKITVIGKGDKERTLPISEATMGAIEKYIRHERGSHSKDDFVFVNINKSPMQVDHLTHTIENLGARLDIDAHPHKFRHTFAINFLRNGGNIYALKAMLGHATLTIVLRYLNIVEADLENAHLIASPVAKWGL